jgi:hypothetical protein
MLVVAAVRAGSCCKLNACVVVIVIVVVVVVGDCLNALPMRVNHKHFRLNYFMQTVNASAHAANNST